MHPKPAALLILIAALALMASPLHAIREKDEPNGPAAPDFTLVTYAGETSRLADYAGDTVILHFWASWAPPSYNDAALLQQVMDRYGDQGIMVIGINHFDPIDDAVTFSEDVGLTYPVAPDPEGAVAAQYELEGVPYTVIITPDGTIAETIAAPLTRAHLLDTLQAVAGIDPPPQAPGDVEAPVPPNAFARYDGIPTGRTPEGFPILGARDALVRIEDFSSFACPHCRDFHDQVFTELVEIVREEDVAFVYVPIFTAGNLPYSLEANRAALCAAEQGYFWIYSDMLFDWHTRYGQSAFVPERLHAGARQLGLDMAAWEACISGDDVDAILQTALDILRDRGYPGTPTITVNGELVEASFDAIRRKINQISGSRT